MCIVYSLAKQVIFYGLPGVTILGNVLELSNVSLTSCGASCFTDQTCGGFISPIKDINSLPSECGLSIESGELESFALDESHIYYGEISYN